MFQFLNKVVKNKLDILHVTIFFSSTHELPTRRDQYYIPYNHHEYYKHYYNYY